MEDLKVSATTIIIAKLQQGFIGLVTMNFDLNSIIAIIANLATHQVVKHRVH